jgi:hypothetical protein
MDSEIDAVAQCIQEQSECKAYLDGPGLDQDGAWLGMCDWIMEECLIRLNLMEDDTVGAI